MKIAYYKCKICRRIVISSKREYHLEKEHDIKNLNDCFSFHHYEIFHSLKFFEIEALDMEV